MPQIYQHAQQVIIWLGETTEEEISAMSNLEYIVRLMQTVDESRLPGSGTQLTESQKNAYDSLVMLFGRTPNKLFEAIWKLFRRDWFGRVWTVQEAAYASDEALVLCGPTAIPYYVISHLATRFFDENQSHTHWLKFVESLRPQIGGADPDNPARPSLYHFRAVLSMRHAREAPPASARLTSAVMFLNRLRMLGCVDPRDRIFTAVPFLAPELVQSIRTQGSMTAENLYIAFAVSELCDRQDMNCLSAAGLCYQRKSYLEQCSDSSGEPILQLPSWVPDWTYPKLNEPLWTLGEDLYHRKGLYLYQASGQDRPHLETFKTSPRPTLCARGIIIDIIADTTKRWRVGSLPAGVGFNTDPTPIQGFFAELQEQVDMFVGFAVQRSMTESDSERRKMIHRARKVLVGDAIPSLLHNSHHAMWVRATSVQIDQMFRDAEKRLHWLRNLPESVWKPSALNDTAQKETKGPQTQATTERSSLPRDGVDVGLCLATMMKRRRFFTTKQGQFGIGPDILMPEDMVCVLSAGRTPFIIRPARLPESQQTENLRSDEQHIDTRPQAQYELVGECFVEGLMDGEAIDMEATQSQDIHLV